MTLKHQNKESGLYGIRLRLMVLDIIESQHQVAVRDIVNELEKDHGPFADFEEAALYSRVRNCIHDLRIAEKVTVKEEITDKRTLRLIITPKK